MKKTAKKSIAKRRDLKPGKRAAIEPSHIRADITARRMGRPRKLTAALIAEVCEKLALGLHLHHVAALVGVTGEQSSVWLRKGRNDESAGTASIERDFSQSVRATLAKVVQRHVGSLDVYVRMAEGWSPTCARCKKLGRGCGAHKKNLRLAADLTRWMLAHRFPRDWNVSTVGVDLSQDESAPALVPGSAGDEDGPRATIAALVMYVPARREL